MRLSMMSLSGQASLASVLQAVTVTFLLVFSLVPELGRAQRLVRLCRDSHIQILSYRGVKIEPYRQSRVELTLSRAAQRVNRNKFRVHFEFKTHSANGTLFYAYSEQPTTGLIAMTLHNGFAEYHMRCPDGYADIIAQTPNHLPLNDGRWHTVQYDTTFGQTGNLTIDDVSDDDMGYVVSCSNITRLVLGEHIPGATFGQSGPHIPRLPWGHFEGCIRKLRTHHLMSHPPRYFAVSQCE